MQRKAIFFVLFLLLSPIELAYAQEENIVDDSKIVDVPVEGLSTSSGLDYEGLAHVTSSELPSGNLTIYFLGFCTIVEKAVSLIPSAGETVLDGVSCSQNSEPQAYVQLSKQVSSSLEIAFDMEGLQFTDSFTLLFPLPLPVTTGIFTGDVDDIRDKYQTSVVTDVNADFGINTTDTTGDDEAVIDVLKQELANNSYLTGAVNNEEDRAVLIQNSMDLIRKGDAAPVLALQDTVVFSEAYPKILEMNAVIKKIADSGQDVSELVLLRDALKKKLAVLSDAQLPEERRRLIDELVNTYGSFKAKADSSGLSTEEEVKKALEERNETIEELTKIKVAAQKIVTAAQIEDDAREAHDRIAVLDKYGVDTSSIKPLLATVNDSRADLLNAQDESDVRARIVQSDQTMRTIARRYEEQKNLTLRNNITDIIGRARAADLRMERIIKGVREAGIDASVLVNARNSMLSKVNQLDNTYYSDLAAAAALVPQIKSDMAFFKMEMNRIFEENPSKFGG